MKRDVVVIGASAGGVEALKEVFGLLPSDFPAAILVVLHLPPSGSSVLPAILSRGGKLAVAAAKGGEPLTAGRVLVAPPDHHLLVHADRARLTRGPRVNGHRPAIDPLFSSAARWRGERVISVVLSGVLDDGTMGTSAVKRAGGVTIAQRPDDALFPTMPQHAITEGGAVHAEPIPALAALLIRLVSEEILDPNPPRRSMPDHEHELTLGEEESAAIPGVASGFTCPDCHGALSELRDTELVRYRCRIGHSYSPGTLSALQSEKIEEALWAGYRALEESAQLAKKLADRTTGGVSERYLARYNDALTRARTLRDVIERGQLVTGDKP